MKQGRKEKEMQKDETRLKETQAAKWKGRAKGKKRWLGREKVQEPHDTTVDLAAGQRC